MKAAEGERGQALEMQGNREGFLGTKRNFKGSRGRGLTKKHPQKLFSLNAGHFACIFH